MMTDNNELDNKLFQRIRANLSFYADKPIKELIESDSLNSVKISSLFLITRDLINDILIRKSLIEVERSEQIINQENKQRYLDSLNDFMKTGKLNKDVIELRKTIEYEKNALPFIFKEVNWILISILSSSYASAKILNRSLFEMVIQFMTTKPNSGMGDMIDGIKIITIERKKILKTKWKELNKWAHPFGHWLKEICPVYWFNYANYNEFLCSNCINDISLIIELIILISYKTFYINNPTLMKEILKAGDYLTYSILDKDFFENNMA